VLSEITQIHYRLRFNRKEKMKKLVLFVVAVVAISFASCGGNKADAEKEAKRVQDSIEAAVAAAEAEAAAKLEASADSLVIVTDSLVNDIEKK